MCRLEQSSSAGAFYLPTRARLVNRMCLLKHPLPRQVSSNSSGVCKVKYEETNPISKLPNLGKKTESWLAPPGIHTLGDLKRIGGVGVFRILFKHGIQPTMNLSNAIEGAIDLRRRARSS